MFSAIANRPKGTW